MPEVEVIERNQTAIAKEGIEKAYVFGISSELTCVKRVRYRRRLHDIRAGAISLMEPGETYSIFSTDQPTSTRVLLVQPALVSNIAAEYCGRETDIHWRVFSAHAPSLGAELIAITNVLPALSRLEAETRISTLVGKLIAQYAEPAIRRKASRASMAGIGRARDLLHARSCEAVTLDDLVRAAECGTRQRLIRGFRTAFGFTPHRYLTQLRLERARHLLRRGHDCGETAHAVGFYDQSQLNRHFVRHLGITPGAYARAVTGRLARRPEE
jgi:AraC-like DNA-binding protein